MFPVERQRWLVDHARLKGRVDVSDAAAALGVAVETIRRDLQDLERRDLLKRVHGGAVPVEGASFVYPLELRQERGLVAEKRRIATAVVGLLEDAACIYLDEGSTTQGIAELLHPTRPLTVVTATLPIAHILMNRPNVELVIVGGRVRQSSHAASDAWSLHMLQDIVVDVAVIGANGVTLEHGCTCPDSALAAVKARAIASARERILACDSSKFGVDSFIRYAQLEDFTHVVTDAGVPSDFIDGIRTLGPTVTLA